MSLPRGGPRQRRDPGGPSRSELDAANVCYRARSRRPAVQAIYVSPESVADEPDLYLFGEGECPVALFERSPGLRELRLSLQEPTKNDSRNTWAAGLWLEAEKGC